MMRLLFIGIVSFVVTSGHPHMRSGHFIPRRESIVVLPVMLPETKVTTEEPIKSTTVSPIESTTLEVLPIIVPEGVAVGQVDPDTPNRTINGPLFLSPLLESSTQGAIGIVTLTELVTTPASSEPTTPASPEPTTPASPEPTTDTSLLVGAVNGTTELPSTVPVSNEEATTTEAAAVPTALLLSLPVAETSSATPTTAPDTSGLAAILAISQSLTTEAPTSTAPVSSEEIPTTTEASGGVTALLLSLPIVEAATGTSTAAPDTSGVAAVLLVSQSPITKTPSTTPDSVQTTGITTENPSSTGLPIPAGDIPLAVIVPVDALTDDLTTVEPTTTELDSEVPPIILSSDTSNTAMSTLGNNVLTAVNFLLNIGNATGDNSSVQGTQIVNVGGNLDNVSALNVGRRVKTPSSKTEEAQAAITATKDEPVPVSTAAASATGGVSSVSSTSGKGFAQALANSASVIPVIAIQTETEAPEVLVGKKRMQIIP